MDTLEIIELIDEFLYEYRDSFHEGDDRRNGVEIFKEWLLNKNI